MRASLPHGLSRALIRAKRVPAVGPLMYRARTAADRALVARGQPPIRGRNRGVEVRGYLRHRSFVQQIAGGHYEAYVLELLLDRLRPGTVVLDGGAHIGYLTLLSAGRVQPGGRVIAVEPDPYNFAALRVNTRATPNVELVAAALSDKPGTATFFSSSGTIAGSLVDKSYVEDKSSFQVTMRTIDSLFEAAPPEDLVLKLDVEGAEAPVLRGAAATLAGIERGAMLVEHNPSALADAGSSAAEIIEILEGHGFSSSFVREDVRELEPLSSTVLASRKGNIWAVKG